MFILNMLLYTIRINPRCFCSWAVCCAAQTTCCSVVTETFLLIHQAEDNIYNLVMYSHNYFYTRQRAAPGSYRAQPLTHIEWVNHTPALSHLTNAMAFTKEDENRQGSRGRPCPVWISPGCRCTKQQYFHSTVLYCACRHANSTRMGTPTWRIEKGHALCRAN